MKPRTINICLLAAGAWVGCLMLDYGVGTRMHKPIVSLTDGKKVVVGGGDGGKSGMILNGSTLENILIATPVPITSTPLTCSKDTCGTVSNNLVLGGSRTTGTVYYSNVSSGGGAAAGYSVSGGNWVYPSGAGGGNYSTGDIPFHRFLLRSTEKSNYGQVVEYPISGPAMVCQDLTTYSGYRLSMGDVCARDGHDHPPME